MPLAAAERLIISCPQLDEGFSHLIAKFPLEAPEARQVAPAPCFPTLSARAAKIQGPQRRE